MILGIALIAVLAVAAIASFNSMLDGLSDSEIGVELVGAVTHAGNHFVARSRKYDALAGTHLMEDGKNASGDYVCVLASTTPGTLKNCLNSTSADLHNGSGTGATIVWPGFRTLKGCENAIDLIADLPYVGGTNTCIASTAASAVSGVGSYQLQILMSGTR